MRKTHFCGDSVDDQGKVGLYRLEFGCSPGTGKLKVAGGIKGSMKESIQRAFAYIQGHKKNMSIAQTIDTVKCGEETPPFKFYPQNAL